MRKRSLISRPLVYSDAFITSFVRYGEKDCIARVLLKEHGRVSAFIKNGMAVKKNSSPVQAPSMARVGFIERDDAKMRRFYSIDISPENYAHALSLRAFAYSSYIAEIIELLLPEEEPAGAIFPFVEASIKGIASLGPQPFLLRAFELHMLDFCGYLPDFSQDADDDYLLYHPFSGCFIQEETEGAFKFTHSAKTLALAMLQHQPGQVISDNMADLLLLGRIFHARLRMLGIKELKSVRFLKNLHENSSFGSGQT